MEKIKVNKGFNKKYDIDYKYVCEGFRPYCEFEYNGKKYGFSVRGRLGYTLEANIDNELTKIIEKGKGSVILANDKIFRGVTICVEGNVYKVERNTSFMKYHNEAGKIVQSVIVAR